jgi:hypothetical protein
VAISGNGTVAPGGTNAIGTLTVTNDVDLTASSNIIMELDRTNTPGNCDKIVAVTVEAGGILTVTNIGPDLQTGDTFQLFSVPVTGAFAVTNLPVTTANGSITYVWTNKLAINGSIQVLVGAPPINLNPPVLQVSASATSLTLAWPTNAGWYLQAQTNSLGKGLGTNWVDVPNSSGVTNVVIPISPTNPTVFYRMSLNP